MTGRLAGAVVVVVAAAWLRVPGLGRPEPGVFRDEVLEGLQGLYHWRGLTVGGNEWYAFSRHPLWELLEALSVGVLGPTVFAIRLPAAACGIGAVALVFDALRRVWGTGPALAGAGLLATSFWNVQVSRIGHGPALLVLLSAVVLRLAIRLPSASGALDLAAPGLIAGGGVLAYYGGVHLPVAACLLGWLAVRSGRDGRSPAFAAAVIAAAAAVPGVALLSRADLFTDMRARDLEPGAVYLARMGEFLRVLVLPSPPGPVDRGFWGIYPRGAALLSPLESALLIGGLFARARLPAGSRWLVTGCAGWTLLALAVGPLADGVVFHRIAAVVVPAAVLQAAGASLLASVLPGAVPVALSALLALNGWRTSDLYFRVRAGDPRVVVWSDGLETRAALALKQRAAAGPIGLVNPLVYAQTPHLVFFLDAEIRSGRVRGAAPPGDARPVVLDVIREPVLGQPALVLFRLDRPGSPLPILMLAPPGSLLEAGEAAAARGDLRGAIAHYRAVLRTFPDLGIGHARLAMALERAGRIGESAAAWRNAERYGFRPTR